MTAIKDSNISLDNDIMRRLIQAAGIRKRTDTDMYTKFSRFPCIDPYNRFPTTREYVFFTKPDCHIFKDGNPAILNTEIENMPIFMDAIRRWPLVLKELQYSADRSYPFMNLLSNTRTSNLDLPGINAEDIETSANIYGDKLTYRKDSHKSDSDFKFNLEFEDTKFLEVYMFLKLFDEYERKKFYGTITPPNQSYILNKILHDQISIFKFIVDDNQNILFYAKLFGCYIENVPRDTFSELPADGGLKLTTSWKAQFVEDMEPNIINDFNKLTANLGGEELPLYDDEIGGVSGEWATAPYIETVYSNSYPQISYKLRWKV